MGRQRRAEFGTGFVHAFTRGNNRQPVFFDEFDYVAWFKLLDDVVGRYGWRCHAYCLMPTHYHVLLETTQSRLSGGMWELNRRFALRMNMRYERTGHVFEGPYRMERIETDSHLLELCRYIPLNPVRARLCVHPADWRWSSYRATADLEHAPPYLTTTLIRSLFGTRETSVSVYSEFVAAGIRDMSLDLVRGHGGLGR
jgi:REP element-mobilizing transposase RayT